MQLRLLVQSFCLLFILTEVTSIGMVSSPLLSSRTVSSSKSGLKVLKLAQSTIENSLKEPLQANTEKSSVEQICLNADHRTVATRLTAFWGFVQVALVVGHAVTRLWPVAFQPFLQNDLATHEAIIYFLWVLFMAYTEGYQGFHLKFSPMVVKRAFLIHEKPSFVKYLLAGPYSMGLFGATTKRMIISWSITLFVSTLVILVKRLPYPYRSIVDGGVVVGLSLGLVSMLFHFIRAILGALPDIDADMASDTVARVKAK